MAQDNQNLNQNQNQQNQQPTGRRGFGSMEENDQSGIPTGGSTSQTERRSGTSSQVNDQDLQDQ